MKILVIDVNSDLIRHIRLILNRQQPAWNTTFIDSGEQCLKILHNGNKTDIVLVGMQLRDMSGFELIKHIRDDSDIPVVLLSDIHDIELLVKAFETGANDYMAKPYNDAVFIARLKALVRRRTWDIQKIENEMAGLSVFGGD
jgi:two-component system, OmpR family, response regulator VanR